MPAMDEEELEEYLRQIERLRDYEDSPLREQLVDEEGYAVPGCFRVVPAPVE